jgi:hypothetical protein
MQIKSENERSEEETIRRRDEALKRALATPPKRHADMKLGKVKATQKKKTPKR